MAFDPAYRTIFPRTAEVRGGRLRLGGCDAQDLVREFGSPLYVFDETELRETCRAYVRAFTSRYADTEVTYASKAYLSRWMATVAREEGIGLDVVSGGELAVALSAGFPAARVHFHGNNKGEGELREALDAGVGRIIVDNFHELELVDAIARARGTRQLIVLRLAPGVDAHTHAKTTTGTLDNKFGLPVATGAAEQAVVDALRLPNVDLVGLHCHLGSPLFDTAPYIEANAVMLEFAARLRARHGFEMREYSPGGGFAAQYVRERPAPDVEVYAEAVVSSFLRECERHGLPPPHLFVEPGRSLIARAGVALYTVGARKEVEGLRTWVSVDGGMADNIRPAIYDAKYEAVVANRADEEPSETVTIAGKYCESGDLLVKDARLPRTEPGDVIALPASGAYNLAMASNYNMALKPAVVVVRDGAARLIRRRETYADLLATDVFGE
ncbi:MAG TPA: diaminopimelate decarboxylase [Dehalococcoidia bacterium]|nr:diaminopimelate decarboxylase [Dehalococcoidia bacterium]